MKALTRWQDLQTPHSSNPRLASVSRGLGGKDKLFGYVCGQALQSGWGHELQSWTEQIRQFERLLVFRLWVSRDRVFTDSILVLIHFKTSESYAFSRASLGCSK
jgi:hypothetical protein